MWEDFTSRLNINAEELIRDNKKEVLNMLVANKHEKVCLYSIYWAMFTKRKPPTRIRIDKSLVDGNKAKQMETKVSEGLMGVAELNL